MHRLPKTVRMGPFIYSIIWSREINNNRAWGEHDPNRRQIRFSRECTPRQVSITLIHELLHVAEGVIGEDLDERIIAGLSHSLAQALMDLGLLPEEMEVGD